MPLVTEHRKRLLLPSPRPEIELKGFYQRATGIEDVGLNMRLAVERKLNTPMLVRSCALTLIPMLYGIFSLDWRTHSGPSETTVLYFPPGDSL